LLFLSAAKYHSSQTAEVTEHTPAAVVLLEGVI
jgi:hypothetical protein